MEKYLRAFNNRCSIETKLKDNEWDNIYNIKFAIEEDNNFMTILFTIIVTSIICKIIF